MARPVHPADLIRGAWWTSAAVLLLSGRVGAQAPPPNPAATQIRDAPAAAPPWLRGSLASRYWGRWTSDASDHDLYGTLTLDVGDADVHPVSGRFVGRLAWDVDGAESAGSPFYSLSDTSDHDLEGLLYEAYVDLNRVPHLAMVRVGRQTIVDTPELGFFDGLRIETGKLGPAEFEAGAYGGVSAHLYEESHSGDWTAGVFTQLRPWTKGRVRLDWMHLEDERLLQARDDDLFAAGIWQQLADGLRVEGQYSRFADRDRDVRASAFYTLPAPDLSLRATYYQMLATQRDLVLEADPLYSALREYFPFWQAHLSASKGFGECMRVDGGADVRRVTDAGHIGIFNRDYERYFLTLGLSDLLDGLDLQLTGDLWQSAGQDSTGFGLDVTKRLGTAWTASAGTYYSLYKYDLFLNRESDDVRTWYARMRHKAGDRLTSSLGFELEDSDLDTFYFLRLEATWRF